MTARILSIVAAAALLVLILLLFLMRMDVARERKEENAYKPILRHAVLELLRGHSVDVGSLVAGIEIEPGRYDFRGSTESEGVSLPLYGIVAMTCDALSADPSCWALIELERDGRVLWPEPEETDLPDLVSDPYSGELYVDPASEGGDDVAAADEATTDESATEEAPPPAIYEVTVERANGRASPSTDAPVVTSIYPARHLILIEAQEEWGRFRFENRDEGEPEEFWIWLGIVTEIPESP